VRNRMPEDIEDRMTSDANLTYDITKYIQDILARCHHHVTFDLRTKKTSDCDRSNRMPT
jgi:hypothetical protein